MNRPVRSGDGAVPSSVPVDEVLSGGVANAGAVVRSGDHVLRPANANTPTIHRFLRHLRAAGFDGASFPVGVDADGRERLDFIDGGVPLPPYPAWAQADSVLASLARLMRRFHEAASSFSPVPVDTWSAEMADPKGGTVVGHNDVCLENVVFRNGHAIGLLDFDFAAPGSPVYDLACMTRMCVPIDDPQSAALLGWAPADRTARLALVADHYGLDDPQRVELIDQLDGTIARGGQFVLRRVEAGEQAFVEMWESMGGMARFDRRRAWWTVARPTIVAALHPG